MPLYGNIPYDISIPKSASAGGLYTLSGIAYNYAIGGLPFLSAASRENPIVRETAPFRKQQFDSSEDPGEQSLDGWWLRSQQTFHGGAGQLWADRDASDAAFSSTRFFQSKGADCWTPGQLGLLRRVSSLSSSSFTQMAYDGTRAVAIVSNGNIIYIDSAGGLTTDSTLTGVTGVDPPFALTMDSQKFYMATKTGIYSHNVTDPPAVGWTKISFAYEASYPGSQANAVVLGWAKERLVVATDRGIYELIPPYPGANYLPSPKWTPPQGTWTPTAITESNSAIYVAGTLTGQRSVILKFTLNASGLMPTLTSGTVVANLPQGEVINQIQGYLGKFLAISTNLGPRIAEIDQNGDLTVGPTLFSAATGQWVARGQYMYSVAKMPEFTGTEGGLARVDLGLQHSELRFAYASDIFAPAVGTGVTGCGLISAGLLICSDGGLYLESATQYVDSGWLRSSRVRYSTLEPKNFKLIRSRAGVLQSDYFVSVIDPNGSEYNVVGYVAGQTPGADDVPVPSIGPQDYLSVKITLSSTTDHLTQAVAGGWQLKAIPAQPHQREIVLPVWCFDFEVDGNGVPFGGLGTARTRLAALEALDRAADTLVLQDFNDNSLVTVSIDKMSFVQIAPPVGTGFAGWGGIVTLTLRTVF